MLKKYYTALIITTSIFSLPALAEVSLFSHNLGGTNTGTFLISAGGTSQAASKTVVDVFNGNSTCGSTPDITLTSNTGSGYTFSPSSTVFISGTGIFDLMINHAFTPTSVQSVAVRPESSGGASVFTVSGDTPLCFAVSCTIGTSCTATGANIVDVTLHS